MKRTFTPAFTQVTANPEPPEEKRSCFFLRLHLLFLRRRPLSLKFLLAAQLCLPRGLSPSLPFPFSPLRRTRLPAVCLPASGSDLSISHKLSVPSLECPLTLIRLELPAAFPFAQSQFQFLLLLGGSWGPARSQSQPKWETRKHTRACARACMFVVFTQACRLPELTFFHGHGFRSIKCSKCTSVIFGRFVQSNFIIYLFFLSFFELNHPTAY